MVLSDLHKKWLHLSLILTGDETSSQQEVPFKLTLGRRRVNLSPQEASPKVSELQEIEPALPLIAAEIIAPGKRPC